MFFLFFMQLSLWFFGHNLVLSRRLESPSGTFHPDLVWSLVVMFAHQPMMIIKILEFNQCLAVVFDTFERPGPEQVKVDPKVKTKNSVV